MSSRWRSWLAWSTCAIYLAGVLVSQGLSLINGGTWYWEDLAHQLVLFLFAIVGALVSAPVTWHSRREISEIEVSSSLSPAPLACRDWLVTLQRRS